MAAQYPTSFDVMSDPGTQLAGPPAHSTMHNQINDVIEAMQREMGLNPSAAYVDITARLDALLASITALQGVTTPTAWTATPAFQNGWANYGSGYQVAQYRKIGDIVYLRGFIKGTVNANTIFILPAGFRPVAYVHTIGPNGSAGGWSQIRVGPGGDLVNMIGDGSTWVSIDMVSFSTVA